MLERLFDRIIDWLLARIGKVRAEELRENINKETVDAEKRMDSVEPATRRTSSQRLRDGSA